MDGRIQSALEKARSNEEADFQALVAEVRGCANGADALVEILQSDDTLLVRAGVEAAKGRTDEFVLDAVARLILHADQPVRYAVAVLIRDTDAWTDSASVGPLITDVDESIQVAAVTAARRYPELYEPVVQRLREDTSWTVRQEAAITLRTAHDTHVVTPLFEVLANDSDCDVWRECALSIEARFDQHNGFPSEVDPPSIATRRDALAHLPDGRVFPYLRPWLENSCRTEFDIEQLRRFGSVLGDPSATSSLPQVFGIDDEVRMLREVIMGPVPRAAVLIGESGVGKTSIVHALGRELSQLEEPWCVLQVSPSDFLTGTTYLGEWETRLSNIVATLEQPKRVVLYIPNVHEIATVGKSSTTENNVASALAPRIESGEVVLIGESTEADFAAGLGKHASLRRLFRTVRVNESDSDQTLRILTAVAEDAGVPLEAGLADRLLELANFYRADVAQPGRVIGLLRHVMGQSDQRKLNDKAILDAIASSTGIAGELLDEDIPLDPGRTREFFESRVLGQPEAVDAVVDLVTLIKARLTDPGKPFGVLMFVGPTGVGKTELARALAEFCFGNVDRLTRLDMSEFATYDSFETLKGTGNRPGILTNIVREQPFSIILLDEIEKAHINVYDLCLQIFDAGRLTDGRGYTVDFRRAIVILTSNVGSKLSDESPVGFGRDARQTDLQTQVHRELGYTFRPEFLNRIDRIVLFRPLTVDTAERIARREIDRVVARSGIRGRQLTVDVSPDAIPLLLREGYSRTFGARPLKRVIERMLLMPLARMIASGKVPRESVVRIVVRHKRLEVNVTQPEYETAVPEREEPQGTSATELSELANRLAALRDDGMVLSARKSALLRRTSQPGFWDRRTEAERISEQIHEIDAVMRRLQTLTQAIEGLLEIATEPGSAGTRLPDDDRMASLRLQTELTEYLIRNPDDENLSDAFVTLSLLDSRGKPLDAVEKMADMYRKLSERHRFQVDVLADQQYEEPADDSIVLFVQGVGAYALLASESGLHQIVRRRNDREHGWTSDRAMVRIEVEASGVRESVTDEEDIRTEVKPISPAHGRLGETLSADARLLHVPTMVSIQARTGLQDHRIDDRLRLLLDSRVRAATNPDGASAADSRIVRRYQLGPGGIVKDRRSGLKTGRVDGVFQGRLDTMIVVGPTDRADAVHDEQGQDGTP